MKKMEFVIVTGVSGAGKSRAINALEDIGFYCVDNMPPTLIPKFADICTQSNSNISRVAIVTDARGGDLFNGLAECLDKLEKQGYPFKILFIDASDETLLRRFKETRRKHPLIDIMGGSIEEAIERERELLKPIKERADYIIDTSIISSSQLKERISKIFLSNSNSGLIVQCMSFGFKYGMPTEADLVFDVRCFPNPFYIEEMKNKTGLDGIVKEFIFNSERTQGFISRLFDMIDFLFPFYLEEGKSQLVIAIGCTGGKHRSVAISESLCNHMLEKGRISSVNHRDINKL
jgi:UPF0042 nucleotide-binding protein